MRFPQQLLNYIRLTYCKKISCRRHYIWAYRCSSLADTHYFAFTRNRQFKTMSFSVQGVNNSMRRPPVLVVLESFNVATYRLINRNVFCLETFARFVHGAMWPRVILLRLDHLLELRRYSWSVCVSDVVWSFDSCGPSITIGY